MKKVFAALAFIFLSFLAIAQVPGRPGGANANMNIGRFYGRIIDAVTDKGIDAASVQLIASRGGKDTIISGMLTRRSGDFSLENLPVMGKFRLNVTAIGYKPFQTPVAFNIAPGKGQDPAQMMAAVDKD